MGCEQEPVSIVWLETNLCELESWRVLSDYVREVCDLWPLGRNADFPWEDDELLSVIMKIKTNLSILSCMLDFHYITSYLKSNSTYIR